MQSGCQSKLRALKSARSSPSPHHMGQEIKPDDYQRLIRERDEARASLASESEKLRVMRTSLERGTDALDMMTERALRAENALRALEQRRERADGPYRVTFVGPE
jgi:predicted  nucleic acid-binding Zn-ribbon protein